MLALLALGQFLGMTPWFSATAAPPALMADLGLPLAAASWLTLAVQAGFAAGTLVSAVINLADIVNARRLVLAGCVAAAAANAAVLAGGGLLVVVALRLATGAALAAVYPPCMKIAAAWFLARRGMALGVLIGGLTLGKAFPYLLAALFGDDWRTPMLLVSGLSVAGGLIVAYGVGDGPHLAATSPFDVRAAWSLFAVRGARLATFGYLGHMWELFAMWAWVGVLATASFAASGVPAPATAGALAAFVAIGCGALGSVAAGWLADRWGRARVAGWALGTSAACAATISLVFGGHPLVLWIVIAIWGFAVVADSAQFSALVSDHAPREHVGTALTVQTCLGFLLTMATIELLPRVAALVGWRHASWLLVPGPLLGLLAMRRLGRAGRCPRHDRARPDF